MLNTAVFLFGLILLRMTGAVVFHPMFGHSSVPGQVKAAFTFVLSLAAFVWYPGTLSHIPVGVPDFVVMALRELLVGFCLGFGVELTAMVVQFAGTLIDFSMGLSMAQMYDPQTGTQMTVSTYIYYALFMLLFFAENAHVRFLEIVFATLDRIPVGEVTPAQQLPTVVLSYFVTCITLGLELALPILGIELMAEIAIGLLMRIVPQINIFVVSFQIKIIVGIAMMILLFSPMSDSINQLFGTMFDTLYKMIGFLH